MVSGQKHLFQNILGSVRVCKYRRHHHDSSTLSLTDGTSEILEVTDREVSLSDGWERHFVVKLQKIING